MTGKELDAWLTRAQDKGEGIEFSARLKRGGALTEDDATKESAILWDFFEFARERGYRKDNPFDELMPRGFVNLRRKPNGRK